MYKGFLTLPDLLTLPCPSQVPFHPTGRTLSHLRRASPPWWARLCIKAQVIPPFGVVRALMSRLVSLVVVFAD